MLLQLLSDCPGGHRVGYSGGGHPPVRVAWLPTAVAAKLLLGSLRGELTNWENILIHPGSKK